MNYNFFSLRPGLRRRLIFEITKSNCFWGQTFLIILKETLDTILVAKEQIIQAEVELEHFKVFANR